MHSEIERNVYRGRVEQIAGLPQIEVEESPPKNLNLYMQPNEINQVLEDHYRRNEDLLD